MKFGIVVSKKDIAGMNIVRKLEELGSKLEVFYFDDEIIYAENIDKNVDFDFIVFASRHQSVKKIKTLTVHCIGNWKKADFGGKDNTICPTSALLLKHFLKTLDKNAESVKDKYLVSMEATHHGPYIEKPHLFIEVGSSEEEWKDLEACEVVAKTIIDSIKTFKEKNYGIAFGVGGPHYCPGFNEIQLGDKYALSHIVAGYGLPLNKGLVKQIIDKTSEKVTHTIIDWKGCGKSEDRINLINLLEEFNLEVIKTSDARS